MGVVVYTGKDTKIDRNITKSRNKLSTVEKIMFKIIFIIFVT